MSFGYYSTVKTVDTTGELIASGPQVNSFFLVKNLGPATVFIGGVVSPEGPPTADQSATGGYPLERGESVQVPTWATQSRDLYGITAEGTADVAVLQMD
jgi:hypothetical protein